MRSKGVMRSFRIDSVVDDRIDQLKEDTGKKKTEIIEEAVNMVYENHLASKLASKVWGFGTDLDIQLMLADFPEQAIYKNPAFEGSVVSIGVLAVPIASANSGKSLIVHMHNYPIEDNQGNFLLIGGPKRNKVTKQFLDHSDIKKYGCGFEGWTLIFGGDEYKTRFDDMERAEGVRRFFEELEQQSKKEEIQPDENTLIFLQDILSKTATVSGSEKLEEPHKKTLGKIVDKIDGAIEKAQFVMNIMQNKLHVLEDYGLLLKVPNPLNKENTIMIIAGCRGFGTGGAALIVSNKQETQTISDMLDKQNSDYFRALIRVTVLNDKIFESEVAKIEALD